MVVQAAVVTGGMIERSVPCSRAAKDTRRGWASTPAPHRVQDAPGGAVQTQDKQSIDRLRHGSRSSRTQTERTNKQALFH